MWVGPPVSCSARQPRLRDQSSSGKEALMKVYVGMEVHRKRSQVAVVDDAGTQQRNRNVATPRPPPRPELPALPFYGPRRRSRHSQRRAPSDQLVGRFDRPVDPAAWVPCPPPMTKDGGREAGAGQCRRTAPRSGPPLRPLTAAVATVMVASLAQLAVPRHRLPARTAGPAVGVRRPRPGRPGPRPHHASCGNRSENYLWSLEKRSP
jgi:hypothetical protein